MPCRGQSGPGQAETILALSMGLWRWLFTACHWPSQCCPPGKKAFPSGRSRVSSMHPTVARVPPQTGALIRP
ncbi:hypothetical protein ASPVEDRAFT_523000 [Aspergillus versicolor CBS 583.65]|uniref:Secreted protein n=1 Tax=Aspergillus versicolor CBS 583.65 TaxID=1036611 RepID=A0A1L9PDY9_ASPVE|nr:uncharacterized protein ASPVEDRAFT_523000 [Aspergillus versicolor CBS 583.65]OJI99701.1 hypothetical protein ASPVEDRAFT_523000 [Aspergillus versicolor CBS 583.65]